MYHLHDRYGRSVIALNTLWHALLRGIRLCEVVTLLGWFVGSLAFTVSVWGTFRYHFHTCARVDEIPHCDCSWCLVRAEYTLVLVSHSANQPSVSEFIIFGSMTYECDLLLREFSSSRYLTDESGFICCFTSTRFLSCPIKPKIIFL
jgi:hypothetical protein